MNNNQKDNVFEIEVKKILESRGYIVELAQRKVIFIEGKYISKEIDFFGLFDLIAKEKGGYTKWIQCKSNPSHVSACKKKLEQFKRLYCSNYETVGVITKMPRKCLILFIYENKQWIKYKYSFKGEVLE